MAAPTREMITIQIGNLANTACIEWWNSLVTKWHQLRPSAADEEAPPPDDDFGVLLSDLEHTASPRAVMVDLKLNIGHRRVELGGEQRRSVHGDGIKNGMQVPNWTGASSVYHTEGDAGGSGWAKNIACDLRSKSLVQVEGFPDDLADSYDRGRALWDSGQLQDQVEDSIRYFAEECDSLDGFNIVGDASTGLLGLVEPIEAMIRDDFGPRKFVANVHLYEPGPCPDRSPMAIASSRLATALSMASLSEYASAILPLQPSKKSLGALSAVGFLETVTSPYRSRSRFAGNPTFSETLDYFRQRGCPVVGASALFPGKISELSALEALLAKPGNLPDVFGGRGVEAGRVFCTSSVCLGLGSLPVQDGGAWLRKVTGAEFDCRMEMFAKTLPIPSQLMTDIAQTRAIPFWDVGRGSKGTSCVATLFQSTAVEAYVRSAAEFCAKVKINVKFLGSTCSDVTQMTEEVTEAAEVLLNLARSYES